MSSKSQYVHIPESASMPVFNFPQPGVSKRVLTRPSDEINIKKMPQSGRAWPPPPDKFDFLVFGFSNYFWLETQQLYFNRNLLPFPVRNQDGKMVAVGVRKTKKHVK